MLASILNFILYLIFLYLILYGIYLLTINLKALISTNAYIKENSQEKFKGAELNKNKLCVIIFANSKSRRLEPLLSALNDQTYDKENYSVHCVFAKDSNSLLYTPAGGLARRFKKLSPLRFGEFEQKKSAGRIGGRFIFFLKMTSVSGNIFSSPRQIPDTRSATRFPLRRWLAART